MTTLPSTVTAHEIKHAEFYVKAVLCDMDGTLVDSISAVEDAWGAVAEDLGKDRQEVIDATHGRRAIDNLRDLKPELRKNSDADMDPHVRSFEEKILESADSFDKEVRSRRESIASSRSASRRASRTGTPDHNSPAGSKAPSRSGSMSAGKAGLRKNSSFAQEVSKRMLAMSITSMPEKKSLSRPDSGVDLQHRKSTDSPKEVDSPKAINENNSQMLDENPFDDDEEIDIDSIEVDTSDLTDRRVQILPSVKRILGSIPHGKWCVATSGASTYCHGALKRVGVDLPPVVITADHPELKRGKPHPDPFLLAASKMGYDAKDCLVLEDSPSGIRAGVASGAAVIAIATSHPIEKIKDCGATYLVPTLDCVTIEPQEDGRLKVLIHPAKPEYIESNQK